MEGSDKTVMSALFETFSEIFFLLEIIKKILKKKKAKSVKKKVSKMTHWRGYCSWWQTGNRHRSHDEESSGVCKMRIHVR